MAKKTSLFEKAVVAGEVIKSLSLKIPKDGVQGEIVGWLRPSGSSYLLRQSSIVGRDETIDLTKAQGKALAQHLMRIFL